MHSPMLMHAGSCLLALTASLLAQPERQSKPPRLDKLAAQTLEKWETLRYHLEGAGVETLSFDLAISSRGGMTGTWKATASYRFGKDPKHPYGVLTWEDKELAAAMQRRGWTAEALARDLRKNSPVLALANARVTAQANERGTILVVTGGKSKDEQFLLFDRAGVLAGEMVGPMQKRIQYEQTDGKYLRIGETYKMPDTTGEMKLTYSKIQGVLVPTRITEKVSIRGKLLSDLSFVLHRHRINGRSADQAAPTSRPSTDRATGSAAALALARRIEAFSGGRAALSRLRNLAFTFNDRRRLLWDRQTDRVRIETLDRSTRPPATGRRPRIMVRDLGTRQDLLTHPARAKPTAPSPGHSIWINDSYWLLGCLKLLDPGVHLSIDPPAKSDDAGTVRLRLRFKQATGMTPGNQYVLHVERSSGRVQVWDYYRSADSAPRSWGFDDYTKIGGLYLSLRRRGLGGGKDIVLSQVVHDQALPKDIWTRTDRYLHKQQPK